MLNKCTFIGHVGADPEIRYTADGTPVAQFNLAVSESWKDKGGNKQTNTTWLKIVAWRKLAEIVGEWVKKGSLLYVEGKLVIREYEGKDSIKRKTHEIVISDMKMLGGREKNGSQGSSGQQRSAGTQGQQGGRSDDDFVHEEDYDDDVPL